MWVVFLGSQYEFWQKCKNFRPDRSVLFPHQPHSLFLLPIPFFLGHLSFIAYMESHNGGWIFEVMQLEVISIALCGALIVKNVMVHSLYQVVLV